MRTQFQREITLNMQNKELFDNILWFLEHFKEDGLEISISKTQSDNDFIEKITQKPKPISLKIKDIKFNREEANSREDIED